LLKADNKNKNWIIGKLKFMNETDATQIRRIIDRSLERARKTAGNARMAERNLKCLLKNTKHTCAVWTKCIIERE